jgi:L-seryl-tRNA(Ser) seleniumtransferase
MINATGNLTVLGGSTPSAAVRKAMQEADGCYVEMAELLEKTGQYIATQLDVEAAYPTAGCY